MYIKVRHKPTRNIKTMPINGQHARKEVFGVEMVVHHVMWWQTGSFPATATLAASRLLKTLKPIMPSSNRYKYSILSSFHLSYLQMEILTGCTDFKKAKQEKTCCCPQTHLDWSCFGLQAGFNFVLRSVRVNPKLSWRLSVNNIYFINAILNNSWSWLTSNSMFVTFSFLSPAALSYDSTFGFVVTSLISFTITYPVMLEHN